MTASWHLRALDDEGNQRTPAWHHGRFGDLATAARTSKITVAIRSVRVLVDHRGSLAVCVPGLGQNACQPGRLPAWWPRWRASPVSSACARAWSLRTACSWVAGSWRRAASGCVRAAGYRCQPVGHLPVGPQDPFPGELTEVAAGAADHPGDDLRGDQRHDGKVLSPGDLLRAEGPGLRGRSHVPQRAAGPRRPSRRYPARSPGEGPPCSVDAPGALPMHLNRAFMCNQGYHGQRVIIE